MGLLVRQDRAAESASILEIIRHRRSADLHRTRVRAIALTAAGTAEEFENEARLLDGHSGEAKCEGQSHRILRHLALGQLAKARRLATSLWRTSAELDHFAYRHFSGLSLAWSSVLREERLDLPAEHSQPARDCLIFLPHLAVLCADAGLEAPLAEAVDIHATDMKDSRSRYVAEELGFARGCLDLARGDAGAAIGPLARLARDSPLLRRHRMAGRAFERLGRWQEAAAEYETAVAQPSMKWGMDNPAVFVFDQYRLARVYDQIGDRDRAHRWYARFVADWQAGDPDIPAIVTARERLDALGGAST
jgi:tetratricopeptide (TPR) repeat protein